MMDPRLNDPVAELARLWGDYRPTRLIELPALARMAHVGRVFLKAEGERPLGNFKSLGGMLAATRALARVMASDAALRAPGLQPVAPDCAPSGHSNVQRLICASDGNHGLAVATAAQCAGVSAFVYLPESASRDRARRIEAAGGKVVWVSGTYDDAVQLAAATAARGEGLLIPDTSTDPDDPVVSDVMSGYSVITRELAEQFLREVKDRPTHVFVQAGVGGLAAALADGLGDVLRAPAEGGAAWQGAGIPLPIQGGHAPQIVVVEPEKAACVALALGRPERVSGDLQTCAEMLSCGLASAPAVAILRRHGARSVLVSEQELSGAVGTLRDAGGPDSTPSGAAGLAGLLHVATRAQARAAHQLRADSNVLLVITEAPAASPPE